MYPNVLSFHEDLNLEEACEGIHEGTHYSVNINYNCLKEYVSTLGNHSPLHITCALVSMETVTEDVEALKQGLKLVEEEQEKEPHNFILFISICHLTIIFYCHMHVLCVHCMYIIHKH